MTHMTQGIVVYEITYSADTIVLNGIYMNDGDGGQFDRPYTINNEIAKRKILDSNDRFNLVGIYTIRYIDSILHHGDLDIAIENEGYVLIWRVFENNNSTPKIVFKGMGIKAGENHLAVSYKSWNG